MEMAAMIRKAMPVHNLSPVRNHTTSATIAAGRRKNRTLATNAIITVPIIKRMNKTANSRSKGKKGNTTPLITQTR